MKDRFTPGLFAGFAGDIVMQIYFQTLKYLGVTDKTYLEYGQILIMYKPYKGVLAFIVGLTFEFIIGGLLGIILSYLVQYTSSRFYILKSVTISVASWLILLAPGTLFKMPLFTVVPPLQSLLMLGGSIIWGVVAAVSLKKLTKDFRLYFTADEL